MAIRAGEWAGHYQVLQLIGRGTFGCVLLAEDPRCPKRQFALKIVPCDHLDADAAARARNAALAEADLLRRLRHPHIVTCHEVCWDAERCIVWLALDYMDGGDVQSMIAARSSSGLSPEVPFVREVLAAVGSALEYVHSAGVLHRDVKPSNILLGQAVTGDFPAIKLADFGISKLMEATGHARTVVGTPYYMAPEIVCGNPYGPASDGWSLGVCLYELATLARPFEAGNQLALARQIVEEPPQELPADVPPDLVQVIHGLLVKEPSARMRLEMAVALSEAQIPQLRRVFATPPAAAAAVLPMDDDGIPSSRPSSGTLLSECLPVPDLRRGGASAAMRPEVASSILPGFSPRTDAFDLSQAGTKQREKENKLRGGPRLWFRFGKHLRPSRARCTGDPEATETTVISAFSYEDDESDHGGSPSRTPRQASARDSMMPERPSALKAWL